MNSLILNPSLYGFEHLTYLAIYIIIFVATILLTKFFIKTEKQKTILLKTVAGLLLIAVLMNRISIIFKNDRITSFIPDTYCGLTSMLLSLFVLFGKPNLKAYHCLWYLGIVGGLGTMLYPDFIGQDSSFFYIPTISGLLHHSILFLLSVLLIQTKWFTPSLKNWKYFPIGFGCYVLYGLFLMDVLNLNSAMSIKTPLIEGTPLKWWFMLIVGTILVVCFEFVVDLIKNKKAKSKKVNNNNIIG